MVIGECVETCKKTNRNNVLYRYAKLVASPSMGRGALACPAVAYSLPSIHVKTKGVLELCGCNVLLPSVDSVAEAGFNGFVMPCSIRQFC